MIKRCVFRLFVVVIVLISFASLGALEIDREEIEQSSDVDIEFENYEGPVEAIDSREAIREIGRVMGRGIADADAADYDQRYLLTRIIGDVEDDRLAADIIELTAESRVDHIENLRRIISGYLETSWEYGRNDADLLARFITIYNAVNRGAMELFSERYREAVVIELNPAWAGLATSYRQWAGQTQLVVPIRDDRGPGSLDAVDPRQLVDARVIDELRTRRDLGIEDRKAIIDFIERVIEERTAAIQEERAALDEEQETIDARQAELDEDSPTDEEVAEDPPEDAADEEVVPDQQDDEQPADDEPQQKDPADVDDAGEDDPIQQDEDADVRDDAEEERRELEDRETEIVDRQEELDEEEEELEELTQRVEELYEETAEDQAALEDQPAPTDLVPFVLGDGTGRFELAVVDFGEAVIAGEQTIPVAHRELTEFQGSIVVAHQSTGRLLMLDPLSLSVIAESDATVVPGSRIRVVDGHLLTVVPDDGSFVVGEFDAQLVLQRRSARSVLEDTDIVIRDEELLVQDEDRELRVLRLDEVAE
ncbi:MAG: P83/100 family protein [Alkalispirochaeta sp.]